MFNILKFLFIKKIKRHSEECLKLMWLLFGFVISRDTKKTLLRVPKTNVASIKFTLN